MVVQIFVSYTRTTSESSSTQKKQGLAINPHSCTESRELLEVNPSTSTMTGLKTKPLCTESSELLELTSTLWGNPNHNPVQSLASCSRAAAAPSLE